MLICGGEIELRRPCTENSNVFLAACAEPLPVSSGEAAVHTFEVLNQNDWGAEITDSEVYVTSAQGLVLVPPEGRGTEGASWKPGRLGVLTKGQSKAIKTSVRKDPRTWSAGEYVAVEITFQKAPKVRGDGLDIPNRNVPLTISVHVSIR